MARTNSNDSAKPVVTEAVLPTVAPATEPAKVDSVVVGGDQPLAGTDSTTAGDAAVTATLLGAGAGAVDADADADVDAQIDGAGDTAEVTIYPLRSYLDGKEVRRAGGKGYKSPKHDAVSLIAAGLATDKKPKA
jgi:hypothetical protein